MSAHSFAFNFLSPKSPEMESGLPIIHFWQKKKTLTHVELHSLKSIRKKTSSISFKAKVKAWNCKAMTTFIVRKLMQCVPLDGCLFPILHCFDDSATLCAAYLLSYITFPCRILDLNVLETVSMNNSLIYVWKLRAATATRKIRLGLFPPTSIVKIWHKGLN